MKRYYFRRINLRRLILFISIAGILVTVANSLYAIYEVQRDELITTSLNANRAYAEKLADVTDAFVRSSRKQLAYSAALLPDLLSDQAALHRETERLIGQSDTFNSVVVVNAAGIIVAASPDSLQVEGVKLTAPSAMQSLRAQRSLVTDPFVSPAGHYVVSVSEPIVAADDRYLGYVAGTIYLEEQNLIHRILKNHSYADGSYVYVVDRNKTLIYHPQKQRVGERVENNALIDDVIQGKKGASTAVNSKGITMLAGYAPIKETGWGVVTQRPRTSTLASLERLTFDVFAKIAPLSLLTLLAMWFAASAISKPLNRLADCARDMDKKEAETAIASTHSWYFEAEQLRRALLKGVRMMRAQIERLRADSFTDPMTGLLNRRGLQSVLEYHAMTREPFSVIILDIDFFKTINDTFGHQIGDEVIKTLAQLMRSNARQGDVLCRAGGDEFLLLLPDTNATLAAEIAERLRLTVATHDMPGIGSATLSLGVAYWAGSDALIERTLKQADDALYRAKQNGRNQYVAAQDN